MDEKRHLRDDQFEGRFLREESPPMTFEELEARTGNYGDTPALRNLRDVADRIRAGKSTLPDIPEGFEQDHPLTTEAKGIEKAISSSSKEVSFKDVAIDSLRPSNLAKGAAKGLGAGIVGNVVAEKSGATGLKKDIISSSTSSAIIGADIAGVPGALVGGVSGAGGELVDVGVEKVVDKGLEKIGTSKEQAKDVSKLLGATAGAATTGAALGALAGPVGAGVGGLIGGGLGFLGEAYEEVKEHKK